MHGCIVAFLWLSSMHIAGAGAVGAEFDDAMILIPRHIKSLDTCMKY